MLLRLFVYCPEINDLAGWVLSQAGWLDWVGGTVAGWQPVVVSKTICAKLAEISPQSIQLLAAYEIRVWKYFNWITCDGFLIFHSLMLFWDALFLIFFRRAGADLSLSCENISSKGRKLDFSRPMAPTSASWRAFHLLFSKGNIWNL